MIDEEVLERAAELVGSRDYAEAQDKQELLKKLISDVADGSGASLSAVVSAIELGVKLVNIKDFFAMDKTGKS
jgi:hypothetical protein